MLHLDVLTRFILPYLNTVKAQNVFIHFIHTLRASDHSAFLLGRETVGGDQLCWCQLHLFTCSLSVFAFLVSLFLMAHWLLLLLFAYLSYVVVKASCTGGRCFQFFQSCINLCLSSPCTSQRNSLIGYQGANELQRFLFYLALMKAAQYMQLICAKKCTCIWCEDILSIWMLLFVDVYP